MCCETTKPHATRSRGSTLICSLFSSHRPPFVFHLRLRCFPFPHLYSLHGESFSTTAAPVQAPPYPGSRAIAHLFSPLRCSRAAMARCYRSWRRLQSTMQKRTQPTMLQPATQKATTIDVKSYNQCCRKLQSETSGLDRRHRATAEAATSHKKSFDPLVKSFGR